VHAQQKSLPAANRRYHPKFIEFVDARVQSLRVPGTEATRNSINPKIRETLGVINLEIADQYDDRRTSQAVMDRTRIVSRPGGATLPGQGVNAARSVVALRRLICC